MTLADAVIVALNNSIDLKSLYLDRILQQFDLRVAENKFFPQQSMTLTAGRTSNYVSPDQRTEEFSSSGGYTATLLIPTGGTFTFVWDNTGNRADAGQDLAYTSNWSTLSFKQPLLRGGGIDNATYSVKVARITEEQNIRALRDKIAATIKSAVTAYRTYLSAKRSLETSRQSLLDAKRTYETNEALITAGRKAKTELVETEANIANQELAATTAQNTLETARLSLVQTLNVEKNTHFELVDENDYQIKPPSLEEAIGIAKKNRADYLNALQNMEITKWTLSNAKWNRMWSLDLDARATEGEANVAFDKYGNALRRATSGGAQRDLYLGLTMTVPFSLFTAERKAYITAKNDLEKAKMNLKKKEVDLEIAVQSAIRDVETTYRQMELAKRARSLSEQKLEVENEKLKVGRTTNFQIVSYQNDLSNAKKAETAAVESYHNSLTSLDETLGTTLATWKIEVKKEDDKVRLPQAAVKP